MTAKFFDAITQIIFLVPAGYFAVLGKTAARPSSIPLLCFPHTFFKIFRDFSSSCAAIMEQTDFKARIRRIVSMGFWILRIIWKFRKPDCKRGYIIIPPKVIIISIKNFIFKSQIKIYRHQVTEHKINVIADIFVELVKAASVRNCSFVAVLPDRADIEGISLVIINKPAAIL